MSGPITQIPQPYNLTSRSTISWSLTSAALIHQLGHWLSLDLEVNSLDLFIVPLPLRRAANGFCILHISIDGTLLVKM